MAHYDIKRNKKGELQARIQVSGKDVTTGKSKIFPKTVYNEQNLTESKFRKYVERAAIEFEDEVKTAYLEQTTALSNKVLTFAELMKEWKANVLANQSISYYLAAQTVEKKFNTYLKERHLDNKPISAITVRDVQMFLNSFNTTEHKYSQESVKGYRRILRVLFNEAMRYEWITKNPVCGTKVGATKGDVCLKEVNEKQVFSIKESQEFLCALDAAQEKHIQFVIPIKLMLLTGMRIAEIHGLRWSDIDFDNRIIHVRRNRLYAQGFGWYEKLPKTKTSFRDIPIPQTLIADLETYKDWFRLADSSFDDKLDEYYIASNINRESTRTNSIGPWLKDFENRHGFKNVTPHGLRHTYCSILLSQNVPIQTVSKYMGHSDSTVTLKVYSHFIPDTQDKAIQALNAIIKSKNKTDNKQNCYPFFIIIHPIFFFRYNLKV